MAERRDRLDQPKTSRRTPPVRYDPEAFGRLTERIARFLGTGRYGAALALTPNDEPLLLRDTGTQDVYSVDWQSR